MKEQDSLATIKKIWKNDEGKVVSAQGASEGMLTWWDTNLFKFKSAIEDRSLSLNVLKPRRYNGLEMYTGQQYMEPKKSFGSI